jgi:hypothetical protein
VDVRRLGRQAAGGQVALPDRRVLAGQHVGQGFAAAHPHRSQDGPVEAALPCQRGSVEREFGQLKHDWALLPLRVRRLERVQLHADLTILARLACALAAARAVPLAA